MSVQIIGQLFAEPKSVCLTNRIWIQSPFLFALCHKYVAGNNFLAHEFHISKHFFNDTILVARMIIVWMWPVWNPCVPTYKVHLLEVGHRGFRTESNDHFFYYWPGWGVGWGWGGMVIGCNITAYYQRSKSYMMLSSCLVLPVNPVALYPTEIWPVWVQ